MGNAFINAFRKANFREDKIIAKVLFFDENSKGTFDLAGETRTLSLYDALAAFANIPNPASQMIEAFNEKELAKKREQMIDNMHDIDWLETNLLPCI